MQHHRSTGIWIAYRFGNLLESVAAKVEVLQEYTIGKLVWDLIYLVVRKLQPMIQVVSPYSLREQNASIRPWIQNTRV